KGQAGTRRAVRLSRRIPKGKESLMISHRMMRSGILAALWVALMCTVDAGPVRADETCNSPYTAKLIKGQEDYVYVWALGVEGLGDGSDKLVTVDVHPKSTRYGKVLNAVSVGSRGEGTHMGFTDGRRFIWAGGPDQQKIYVFHIGHHPAKHTT